MGKIPPPYKIFSKKFAFFPEKIVSRAEKAVFRAAGAAISGGTSQRECGLNKNDAPPE